jgi:hypothetical protein
MSLAVNPIEPVLILDKRMDFEKGNQFGVMKTGKSNTFRVLPTQNYSASGQNIIFNAQPPAPSIAISRKILTKWYLDVVFTGTAGANGLLLAPYVYDAPRAFPIANCTQSMNATINNATVNLLTYQCINAFSRCNISREYDLAFNLSTTPSMPDMTQRYVDVEDLILTPYDIGVANDPLQSAGMNSFLTPRGGFPFVVVSNTATTAHVTFEVTEPLWVSPFLSMEDDNTALLGVQTLTLNFNLGNLARCWSHSDSPNAGVIATAVGTLAAPPEIHLNFITPSDLMQIPRNIEYNYANVDIYSTPLQAAPGAPVGPNVMFPFTSNNIQFNTIPKRIIIFARRNDTSIGLTASSIVSTTDTFAVLHDLSINFDNTSGIFASASQEELYYMSRESGMNLSWTQYSRDVGSVQIIDVGKALALVSDFDSPSVQSTKQFQVQGNFINTNQDPAGVFYTLYILVISDGVITILPELNSTIQQNSVLSKNDVLNAKQHIAREVEYMVPKSFYGSGNFKKAVKKAASHFAKKPLSHLGHLGQAVGLPGSRALSALGHVTGYGRVGGARVGGRMMSKAALKKRAMEGYGFAEDRQEQEYNNNNNNYQNEYDDDEDDEEDFE